MREPGIRENPTAATARALFAAALALTLALLTGAAPAQPDPPPARSRVAVDGGEAGVTAVVTVSPYIAISLVIDASGSMQDDGKIVSARDAASMLVDVAFEGDEFSVVSFNKDAAVCAPSTRLESADDRRQVQAGIAGIGAVDATNMGAGIAKGLELLAGRRPEARQAIVLLSDGRNTDRFNDQLERAVQSAVSAGCPIYCIAFGDQADEENLRRIAERTGGRYFEADLLNLRAVYDLLNTFTRGMSTLLYINNIVQQGREASFDFEVYPGTPVINVSVSSPDSEVGLVLEEPDGTRLDGETMAPREGVDYRKGESYVVYTVFDPKPGTWRARVYGVRVPDEAGQYTLTVSALLDVSLVMLELQSYYDVGDTVELGVSARMTEDQSRWAPLAADVEGRVSPPKEAEAAVALRDDGASPDSRAGDGLYVGAYRGTGEVGVYGAEIRVASRLLPQGSISLRSTFLVGEPKVIAAQRLDLPTELRGAMAAARVRVEASRDANALAEYAEAAAALRVYFALEAMTPFLEQALNSGLGEPLERMAAAAAYPGPCAGFSVFGATGGVLAARGAPAGRELAAGDMREPVYQHAQNGHELLYPVRVGKKNLPKGAVLALFSVYQQDPFAFLRARVLEKPEDEGLWVELNQGIFLQVQEMLAAQLAVALPHYFKSGDTASFVAMLEQVKADRDIPYFIIHQNDGVVFEQRGLETPQDRLLGVYTEQALRADAPFCQEVDFYGQKAYDIVAPVIDRGWRPGVIRIGVAKLAEAGVRGPG